MHTDAFVVCMLLTLHMIVGCTVTVLIVPVGKVLEFLTAIKKKTLLGHAMFIKRNYNTVHASIATLYSYGNETYL